MTKFTYDKFEVEIKHKNMLFACVSGSHAYGTNRPDSDLDVRGVWIPKISELIDIQPKPIPPVVTVKKGNVDFEFMGLLHWCRHLAKGNGNFMENIFQDKIMQSHYSSIEYLQTIVLEDIVSKKSFWHYYGFSQSMKKDYYSGKMKCVLYAFRVLMSGIVLMRDGKINYNLLNLNEEFDDALVSNLIETYDSEHKILENTMIVDDRIEYYEHKLKDALNKSRLREKPKIKRLNDWFVAMLE